MKRTILSYILIGLSFTIIPLGIFSQSIGSRNRTEILKFSESISKYNLFFIENKGQWAQEVKYLARMNGLNFWVTDKKIIFDFFQDDISKNEMSENIEQVLSKNANIPQFKRNGCVIEMSFNGDSRNRTFSVNGQGKKEGYINYILGNSPSEWVSSVPIYSELYLKNVSDGIDMKIVFDKGYIRYDLIVKPGGDLSLFKMNFKGQGGLSINNDDEIEFRTNLGKIVHKNLYSYQEYNGDKVNTDCRFVQSGLNEIAFEVGNYNSAKELIIDPLIFSSYLGGSLYDEIQSVITDTFGNIYLAGSTVSINFPVTSGAYSTSYNGGNYDAFLTKMNTSGTGLIYSTYLGGGGTGTMDNGLCVGVMTSGEAVISGTTSSTNFPVTGGAYKTTNSGGSDVFITKLNVTGTSLIYSTYIGGSLNDVCWYFRLDASGNAYLTGCTNSTNFPFTSSAYQTTIGGGTQDGFVTKLNSNGTAIIYSTYLGGNGTDYAMDIEIDHNLNAFVTGYTNSTNFRTTSGSYQPNSGGGSDAYIVKLNPTGTTAVFSTLLGKSGNDISYDVEIDSNLQVVIIGSTTSTNFTTTAGAIQTSYGGGSLDAFVAKLNSTGSSLLSFTYLGGYGSDDAIGLSIDHYGNIYVVGRSTSTNFPVTNCSFQTTNAGSEDIYISKMTNDLTAIIYSSYFGGSNTDQMNTDITLDRAGNIVITGRTISTNFPITSGAFRTTFNGGANDGFIAKIDMSYLTSSIVTGNLSTTSFCGGGTVNVPFTSSCPFNYGNIFTVQLSDRYGNFNNPLTIGSLQGFRPVTITAKIPDTLTAGSLYKIRVISSDPFAVGTAATQNITISQKPNADFSVNDSTQCLRNNSFSFTNTSTIINGNIAMNNWNFGDGGNSTQTSPAHNYLTANIFNVRLITISDYNCRDTIIKKVYVDEIKKVTFDINDSTQCLKNNQFNFTNKTTGFGSISYLWSFGNGNTSSNTNASKSYTYDSAYSIILRAYSAFGCSDSTMKKVYVYPDPYVNFLVNNSNQCFKDNNFAFTNQSSITSGTLKYLWNFGDGDTSGIQNVQHKYSSVHNYSVQLWVSSDHGCKDSVAKTIYLYNSPVASFTVNNNSQCLSSNNFVFTNTTTGASTSQWNFGDASTSGTTSPSHTYTTVGAYTVKLITTSTYGCNDSTTKTVDVRPQPGSSFTVNNNSQCLVGNIFVFTNTTTESSTYLWNFGDASTSGTTSPSHTYTSVGTFTVKLVSTTTYGCKDSTTKTVDVMPKPVSSFTINNNSQCLSGNNFVFTNTTTGASKYHWSFGDGDTSGTKSPSHSYTTSGAYTVKLVSMENASCKDSITNTLDVRPKPVSSFTINDSSQCLKGNNFTFSNTTTGASTYLWYFGDDLSSMTTSPSHTYLKVGSYTVKLVSTNTYGCIDSINKVVNVWLPVVNLGKDTTIYGTDSLLLDAGSGFDSYLWLGYYKTRTMTVSAAKSGYGVKTIYVKVTKEGCEGFDTIIVTIKEKNSIIESQAGFDIQVYPNPANSLVNISLSAVSKEMVMILTDMFGKQLKSIRIKPDLMPSNHQVDISEFAEGVYYLDISNAEIRKVVKIIKY